MRKSRQILFCPLVSLVALELIIICGRRKNAYTFHAPYLSWQGSLGLYFHNLNGSGTAAQTVQVLLIRLNLSYGNYSFSLCISFLNKRVPYFKYMVRGSRGACWEAWKILLVFDIFLSMQSGWFRLVFCSQCKPWVWMQFGKTSPAGGKTSALQFGGGEGSHGTGIAKIFLNIWVYTLSLWSLRLAFSMVLAKA